MQFYGELLEPFNVEIFISKIFDDTQHAKRVKSIANAALGVIVSTSLFVHKIRQGLAKALILSDKYAIKPSV